MGRVMIAGISSESGKTTMVCGLLKALVNRQKKVVSFKCGPDYIDPMFHSNILHSPCYNLDGFFFDKTLLRGMVESHSQKKDIAVIEGVMGYYDGIGMEETASAYQIARDTETPVILVVSCKGMSRSILALLKGFFEFVPDHQIKGVIFNRLPASLYPVLRDWLLEQKIKPLGNLPFDERIVLESRHLGLVTAQELTDLEDKIQIMAQLVEEHLDVDAILSIADQAKQIEECMPRECGEESVRIAVARDKAFCFYYEDNLQLLRELGCELVSFSPLTDNALPEGIHGILLGGGYPELYAQQLQQNESMRKSIKRAIENKIPTFGECGGFLYLHENMTCPDGKTYQMVGSIPFDCYFTSKLQHFGYVTLTAEKDCILAKKGMQIRAHEFHRCVSNAIQDVFETKKNQQSWGNYYAKDQLVAGFAHIHFYANKDFARHFVMSCRNYKKNGSQEKCTQ